MRTLSCICAALLLPGVAVAEEAPAAAAAPVVATLGDARVTLGGAVELVGVYRSTNVGSGLPTAFAAIPYDNTIQGKSRSDLLLTAQRSRLGLGATDRLGDFDVTAFAELDFLGNSAPNTEVSTGAYSPRMRHYWASARVGDFELLAGQTWTWLTPNRVGLSADTKAVFVTQNLDDSLQAGLTWGRAGQVRFVYHPTSCVAVGLAVENPDPYVGVGEVIFPFAYNASLGSQFDAGNNPAAPSGMPDFIPKVAFDLSLAGRAIHLEAAGLVNETSATTFDVLTTMERTETVYGVGGMVAADVELLKGVQLVATGFASRGGGRRIGGLGPDVVIRPNGKPSLVRSYSALVGVEAQPFPRTTVAAYGSLAYFERNAFADTTSPLVVKPEIGFGGKNSPSSANKKLEQATVDVVHTLAEAPKHGALQVAGQVSVVRRTPWFVVAGAPDNAKTWMGFLGLRYLLP